MGQQLGATRGRLVLLRSPSYSYRYIGPLGRRTVLLYKSQSLSIFYLAGKTLVTVVPLVTFVIRISR